MDAYLDSGVIIPWGLTVDEEADGCLHRIEFIFNQAC